MPVNPILSPETTSNSLRIASGIHTTVAASDEITTGLSTILAVGLAIGSSPTDDLTQATYTKSGGTLTIETWKNTSGTDPTPAAATSFGATVSWIAVGY